MPNSPQTKRLNRNTSLFGRRARLEGAKEQTSPRWAKNHTALELPEIVTRRATQTPRVFREFAGLDPQNACVLDSPVTPHQAYMFGQLELIVRLMLCPWESTST